MKVRFVLCMAFVAALITLGGMGNVFAADAYKRPMPTRPLTLGKTVLGGETPVICVPLTAQTEEKLIEEARHVASLQPDMVEVRADYWDFIQDTDKALKMLGQINDIMGDIPILLTVRIKDERGFQDVPESAKFNFYKAAARDKLADLIDIELAYGPEKIQAFKKEIADSNIPLVVAYHDMKATPSAAEIRKIMENEIAAGGDVAKIVVKPNSEEDVLVFLNGMLDFRRANPEYPIIASGSGDVGRITRLIGGLNGIDLTFASGVKGSNPTQMPVKVVRDAFEIIYPQSK